MSKRERLIWLLALALGLVSSPSVIAQAQRPAATVESNVVYGMYSGLALLMDVHRPAQPNGIAIVAIQGSGWYSPMRYDASQLKASREVTNHAERFAAAGYTVFAINHRQAPRFRYPAPIEDAQRAVRFVRSHASDYGITSDRIGAWGSSSGGHLVELLGTMDGKGDASDSDPANRLSAKVQAVVALFAPSDLMLMFSTMARPGALTSLMGFSYQDPAIAFPGLNVRPDDLENRQYREASPLTHVTADDPPMLLMHGDEDTIAPINQSEIMESALKQAGVTVRFIRVAGGKHGPNFQLPAGDPRLPDHVGEAVRWFDRYEDAMNELVVVLERNQTHGGPMRGDDKTHTTGRSVNRRAFLITTVVGLVGTRLLHAQSAITRPVVSEKACPLETIYPVAADGHRGLAVLRKPPGAGPFPVIVWFHGDITIRPLARLEETARDLATGSRFLAAGYVFVAPTYRSRDVDLQTADSVEDALAVVEYLRKLPFVERQSIVVCGCSGGGDLALQVAARTNVCAVVAEEPASVLMSGVFNNNVPKRGERYTPADSFFMLEDGRRYYTSELQRTFRAKLAKIDAPILIVQGDVDRGEAPINRFNADVLIPELRASSRQFDVQTYPGQAHCFCSASGLPRPGGMAAPASWPVAALEAFHDIDAFCRRHVRTAPVPIDREHVTYTAVRTGPISK